MSVTRWAKGGVRRAALVGVLAIAGIIVAGGAAALAYRQSHRVVTEYTIDMPAAPFGGGGACYGCQPFDGLDLTDRTVGVAAELPTDPIFRGLVVTSSVFPPGLRNARVMPDGYYLEFTDATVRFVADDAPWRALEPALEPEWTAYILGNGVIDHAP